MSYRRYRYYGRRRVHPGVPAVIAVALAAAAGGQHVAAAHASQKGAPAGAAARAVSFALAQRGRPYCWGGTGPSCFDCSGLVQAAWASAGVSIPRTTFAQWAGLRHLPASQAAPGDLVLAPGSDGSWSQPGHVGMLLAHGQVIEAYATGYPIFVTSLAQFAAGSGGIVGFAEVR